MCNKVSSVTLGFQLLSREESAQISLWKITWAAKCLGGPIRQSPKDALKETGMCYSFSLMMLYTQGS